MEQSVAMEKFVARIRPKYTERRLNREKQWPPCKSEKLVRLELVEGERRQGYSAGQTRGRDNKASIKRSPLAYADILKAKDGEKTVRIILVEGDAGIGKTTLCTALSEDWANGKLFQEFEVVLLLHLRQNRIASAGSLLELLKLLHPSQKVCELVAEYVEEQEGKVLIIADGWDELSTVGRSEGSFLYELLFGECYSLSVIVTSRPSASAPLHYLPCIDRLVEVCGFSKDNTKEFIQCEFADDKAKCSGLLEQLEGNPLIESVCSVPLNCAIICHLWHYFKGALPTTMSELYTKIILNVILHNIQKRPEYESIPSLSHFDALPVSLQQPWLLLCELAFQTLFEDRIVFSHEQLSTKFNLVADSKVLCFGLLQSADSILIDGHGVSFHFLHLTFQEYLAALHVVRWPSDIQLQLCGSYTMHTWSKRFEMVWRFFFGLSFKICEQLVSSDVSKVLIDTYYNSSTLIVCHFAFEANQRSINVIVTSKIKNDHGVYLFARTAFDFAAFVHIITNLRDCSGIHIDLSSCGLGDKQIAVLADALAGNEHKRLQVSQIDLSGNKLTDQSVADLFDRASPAFSQSLRNIRLGVNNMIGPKGINSIATVLAKSLSVATESVDEQDFEECTELVLADSPLWLDGLRALSDALCANKLANLEGLYLAGSLTDDADTNAELIFALGSGHCCSLKYLDLSRNNLDVPGGKALGKVLPQLPSGVSLYLNETMLGDKGIAAFTQNLLDHVTCKLVDLTLESNDIHAAGVSCLAKSVCAGNISLSRELSLVNNPLKLDGVTTVIQMLISDHFQADSVYLSGCQLTTAGGSATNALDVQHIICNQQLQATYVINEFVINNNNFSGEGIHILAAFMYVCPYTKALFCKKCGITSDDLKQLLVLLSELRLKTYLFGLNLMGNDIDDDGMSVFIQYLSIFPNLSFFHLDFNIELSSGMFRILKEKLNAQQKVHLHCLKSRM